MAGCARDFLWLYPLNKESPMSWGQGAYYVRIKPPYICTYYLYRFLCTGRDCGKISWVAAEYIIIRCGCVVIAITLRLCGNIIYVAAVYIIYIIYTYNFYGKSCSLRLLTVGWVRFIYYIYIIYIILYVQVVRWSALRVSRSALCALRILELDTLRYAGKLKDGVIYTIDYFLLHLHYNVEFPKSHSKILKKI